ncbi:hypothetical protein Lgra_0734 [Legionella gratiana]|uniref:Nuclear transport factor 2 family protein n=1 Tax=Legionella gratiana TaxID=45066 RepID=A0A378JEE1_9GAMM|nr:hypothetical protein [Legionella gratiana]KTD14124.1 hypothetical protein Lgra_0734 [Legionella gratiana]STX46254.1 Uncharacterised protein [Legionella gratiana]
MKKNILVRFLSGLCLFVFQLLPQITFAEQSSHYIPLLKEMFAKVTVEKNAKVIPFYYDKDFELYSNGNTMKYQEFLQLHQAIYKTPIQYKIRYDEETFVEQGNKVAGRLFISTKKPNESEREIEVILVAEYKKNKLYRVWELTYPDWSKMKRFEKNAS